MSDFVRQVRVRRDDCDPARIAFHSHDVRWMHEGERVRTWGMAGPDGAGLRAGPAPPDSAAKPRGESRPPIDRAPLPKRARPAEGAEVGKVLCREAAGHGGRESPPPVWAGVGRRGTATEWPAPWKGEFSAIANTGSVGSADGPPPPSPS